MSEGMKKIRITVSTDRVGSRVERVFEVEADVWDESTPLQQEQWAYELMNENGLFSWDFEEVGE